MTVSATLRANPIDSTFLDATSINLQTPCIHITTTTRMHTYMHTYMHAYMHTCIHTYICMHAYQGMKICFTSPS